VALSPDGRLAYVTQQGLNTVTTLDVATGAIRGLTAVGDHPTHIVVTRDGKYAFVTNANDDSISILDLTGPVPLQTRQLSTHLFAGEANGSTPNAVALDEDRGLVYVATTRSRCWGPPSWLRRRGPAPRPCPARRRAR
jgi:YVTN family beta-propeller protein